MSKNSIIGRILVWTFAGIPVLIACAIISGLSGAMLGSYLYCSADLPKIPDLRAYRPKTVSTFYADDGSVIGVFYKEKRFPIPLDSMPKHVVNAFLAAEDARFFRHTGVDVFGVVRAAIKNIYSGSYAQGGSTITQQVTKNFILSTKEKTISRKIREAILSVRLEKTLSKNKILELYINEIYLGKSAYGVEAAAQSFFNKNTSDLSISEAAFLAGMVANPSTYSQPKHFDAAMRRREFVLGNMLKNGFISESEYKAADSEEIKIREDFRKPFDKAPYFTEAVRQYIVSRYGEGKLYNEGLQVWTTCLPDLQRNAAVSLMNGARAWEARQGRPRGLVRRLKPAEAREFIESDPPRANAVGEIIQALVVENKKKPKQSKSELQECILALPGDKRFQMNLAGDVKYKPNDLIELRITANEDNSLTLEHEATPKIQGAVVCMENNTGYVRALVGGLDFERSRFNRAVHAQRQPGSAFKPLVFAAALEWGSYSPNTIIIDDAIAVSIDPRDPEWIPMNSDNGFHGPMTLRQGLAHSRNIVAIKLLMDVGIDPVVQLAHDMGIQSPVRKHLSSALGASEVTPLEITSAYTVFPNLGLKLPTVMVKKVVDRFGNVLEDNSIEPINPLDWTGEPAREINPDHESEESLTGDTEAVSPRPENRHLKTANLNKLLSASLPNSGKNEPFQRVLSPQSAYLMLSMLREVCVSGTGAASSKLKRKDLVGKTGTTDDCSDAWFVGSSTRYTTGVWLGYDAKVSLGKREHGAVAALPVWMEFMKNTPASESGDFPVPSGIVFSDPTTLGNQGRRLESGPDIEHTIQVKQISPVDNTYMPASGQPLASDQFYSDAQYVDFQPNYQQGAVRVLSPQGQTIGYGSYIMDKNRLNFYRVSPETGQSLQYSADPDETDNGTGAGSPYDYQFQGGWFQ